jgi:SAM-dependent methyltransferase
MDRQGLTNAWTRIMAPRTGDVRTELVEEIAEFLGLSATDAEARLSGAGERFRDEWTEAAADARDPAALADFYNRSDAELFELAEWHASDLIHHRTLVVRDIALERPGRRYLDYGSGIGSDALAFADAGFDVTLADVSDRLLAFAAWRCRRRGACVHTIDLKRQQLPDRAFDVAICFDVLEHIPQPVPVVRTIGRALNEGGLLAVHAPFGPDPDRPMHVVHRDVVTPRMRSLGFQPIDRPFPSYVWAPKLYERRSGRALDRLGYFVYDGYLNNSLGARLAAVYRRTFRRPPRAGVPTEA